MSRGGLLLVVLLVTKSEGVGECSRSRNDVELLIEQPSSSVQSLDDDGKIVVVTSFPGADGGRRKEDELTLSWVLTPLGDDIHVWSLHVDGNNYSK